MITTKEGIDTIIQDLHTNEKIRIIGNEERGIKVYEEFLQRNEKVINEYFQALLRIPMYYSYVIQLEELEVEYRKKYYGLGSICQFEDTINNRIRIRTKYLGVSNTPKEAIPIEYVEQSIINSTLKYNKITVNNIDNILFLDMCIVSSDKQKRIIDLITEKVNVTDIILDILRVDTINELDSIQDEIIDSTLSEEEKEERIENINKINEFIQKKEIYYKEYIHKNALHYKTEFLNTRYTLSDLDILSLD